MNGMDALVAFKSKCDELLQSVNLLSDDQKVAGFKHWSKFLEEVSQAFTVSKTDVEHDEIKASSKPLPKRRGRKRKAKNTRKSIISRKEPSRNEDVSPIAKCVDNRDTAARSKALNDVDIAHSVEGSKIQDTTQNTETSPGTRDNTESTEPINNTAVLNNCALPLESEQKIHDSAEDFDADAEVSDHENLVAIEEEIEFAKPKSNIPEVIEDIGTPNTNDDASDFGSLLSFLPQLSPMVKVDGQDCIVTDKEGFLHIQIEKSDGTVQNLMLTARNEDEPVAEETSETEETSSGGKKLHLIKKYLDRLGKENEPEFQDTSDENESKVVSVKPKRKGRKPRPVDELLGDVVTFEGGLKGFMCRQCPAILKTHSSLEVHMRSHNGEKPFTCDVCQKGFATKGNMLKHKRTTHEDIRPFECEVCHSRYKEKKTLITHMRTHTGEKPFKCQVCERTFAQSVTLQAHMRIHSGEKAHLCDTCGKSFRTKSQLAVHQRRHDNLKNYKCTHCDFSCVCKGDLDRHMNRHTNSKPFLCTVCPKTFTRSQYLREHMNVHLDKKPFSCKICKEAFSDQGSLYRHKRKHKEEKSTDSEKSADTQTVIPSNSGLPQDLQVVISENPTTEQDLQKLQAIIVSATNGENLDGEQEAISYMETDGASGETEVYRITCNMTDGEPVVVDFSAMNMLANATAKQFTIQ